MKDPTIWERLRWWLTWRIWNPVRGRCAWCGFRLIPEDEYDAYGYEVLGDCSVKSRSLGFGAWACEGCTEYGDG